MDEQDQMQHREEFFDKKRNVLITVILLPVLLAVSFAVLYVYLSKIFAVEPKVAIHAENRFERTLRVVTDRDYRPYSYIDSNGEYTGFDVELINEVANRLQMNLDLTLLDWDDANSIFEAGDADIILNMESDLILNNPKLIATLPTSEKQYVVYGRSRISSLAELYGRRVASLHRITGLGLDDEIGYIDSYRAIFEGLKTGEYEFAICPIQVGDSFVKAFQLDDVFPSYAVQHVYGTMALHAKDTVLRVKINAILIQMQQEGLLDALNNKWITQRYENMTLLEMVQSRSWLMGVIVGSVFLVMLLIIYIVMQYRNARTREAYTMRLQDNLMTINRQQEELKVRQQELIDEKNRAEAASKAKSVFLSNMSHDIRTPMNAIIGYTNLALRENTSPDEVKEFLAKIGASSQHLLSLINDVLEMSRIESGKMELMPIESNLCTIIMEVYDMFLTQMRGKNIDFEVDMGGVKNPDVLCDQNRLNRVLLNLVSNAYKFTPDNGRITITLKQLDGDDERFGNYELRVEDTGIGMTPEFAAKVFEAFERERNSTVSGIQGTGLGMAITKSIVDLMGGTIEVISAPNQGTEFIIHLRFELSKIVDENESGNADGADDFIFTKNKLLLVDDIEVNREIALMILEDAGFEVDTAVNGKDAVEKVFNAKPGQYDAILMDIQMPVMNGYEATIEIRSLKDHHMSKIPIIAMTANAFSEDIQNAKEAGMNGHIAKPIDINNMMETLKKVLK